jgi:hypothetical protein
LANHVESSWHEAFNNRLITWIPKTRDRVLRFHEKIQSLVEVWEFAWLLTVILGLVLELGANQRARRIDVRDNAQLHRQAADAIRLAEELKRTNLDLELKLDPRKQLAAWVTFSARIRLKAYGVGGTNVWVQFKQDRNPDHVPEIILNVRRFVPTSPTNDGSWQSEASDIDAGLSSYVPDIETVGQLVTNLNCVEIHGLEFNGQPTIEDSAVILRANQTKIREYRILAQTAIHGVIRSWDLGGTNKPSSKPPWEQ